MVSLEAAGIKRESKITTIATLTPIGCFPKEKILNAVDTIIQTKHRRLPIISHQGKLVGIVTVIDLLDAFLRGEDFEQSVEVVMTREVLTCDETETIESVLGKIKFSKRGIFPIVDTEKNLMGVVTERDFVRYFTGTHFGVPIGHAMTPKPFFVTSHLSILDCLRTIVNVRYRRLPVIEKKQLVGLVCSTDLLKYINAHDYNFEALDEPLAPLIIRDIFTVPSDVDVSFAVRTMVLKKVGGLLVVDGKKNLRGIITERDVLKEID